MNTTLEGKKKENGIDQTVVGSLDQDGINYEFVRFFLNIPRQQIQYLFESGLLVDLCECDSGINEEKIKYFLKPYLMGSSANTKRGLTTGQYDKFIRIVLKSPEGRIDRIFVSNLIEYICNCDIEKICKDEFRRLLGYWSPAFATYFGEIYFSGEYKKVINLPAISNFEVDSDFRERFFAKEERGGSGGTLRFFEVIDWPGK